MSDTIVWQFIYMYMCMMSSTYSIQYVYTKSIVITLHPVTHMIILYNTYLIAHIYSTLFYVAHIYVTLYL